MRLRIHPQAEAEFLSSVDFYSDESIQAAQHFIEEVGRALDEISVAPLRYVRYEGETHFKPLDRFPFSIVYRIKEEEVQVIAILHQARRPGYWQGRELK